MATNNLNIPLGKLKAKSGAAPFAALKKIPIFSVLSGFLIAVFIIATVVLNMQDAPYRGEPVLRLSMDQASQPVVTAEKPIETPFELRPTLDNTAPAVSEPRVQEEGEVVIRSLDQTSPDRIQRVPAPLLDLLQSSSLGMLPTISSTGLKPMVAYARPSGADTSMAAPARIALVVGGLGLNSTLTAEAMRILPADVSLAFAPYGSNLEYWTGKARDQGHEFFLQMPLEPFDYPDNDPGPHTLLTSLRSGENLQRMRWFMTRISGYAGVINHMGAKYTSSEEHTLGMMKELQQRGLLYIDDGSSQRSLADEIAKGLGHPTLKADVIIDADPKPEAIGLALSRLENIAKERGSAVGVASILPITLSNLSTWVEQMENRGIVLVPATSLILQKQ